jgi:hypothetical protein
MFGFFTTLIFVDWNKDCWLFCVTNRVKMKTAGATVINAAAALALIVFAVFAR